MLVAGSSGTGKTTFVRSFLRDYLHTTNICKPRLRVLYYFGQAQPLFDIPIGPEISVKYVRGFSDEHEEQHPDIVVIDDLMSEAGDDKRLTDLFTKGSHHLGISVIFLVQNLFHKGREMRTISLNSQYIVAMNNPRDRMQLMALGRQIFPKQTSFFSAVITQALIEPFSHIIIDLTPGCHDDFRLRQRRAVKGSAGFTVYIAK